MSQRIAQSAIEEGMTLAEPVMNRQGQVLLAAGTKILARHRVILKTWGIAEIVIATGDEAPGETEKDKGGINKEMLARAMTRLSRRWLWKPRCPLEKEIYLIAIKRAAELALKAGKE